MTTEETKSDGTGGQPIESGSLDADIDAAMR